MKNPEIQRLRGIAVLLIVFTHADAIKGLVHPLLINGSAGVDLFFVISGFVVSQSLMRLLPDLETVPAASARVAASMAALAVFYKRRFFRIAPAALFWAAAALFLSAFFNRTLVFSNPPQVFREIMAIITLRYNYAYARGGGNELGNYWSLSVEEHFYLVLPLLFVLAGTRNRRLAAAGAGIALVVFVLRPLVPPLGVPPAWRFAWDGFTSHRRFDSLFAGVLLALLFRRGRAGFPGAIDRKAANAGVACLAVLVWVFPSLMSDEALNAWGRVGLWMISGAMVFLASLERGFVFGVPTLGKVLEFVGDRSYSLYLTCFTALKFNKELVYGRYRFLPGWFLRLEGNPVADSLVYCAIAFLFAEASYRWIEAPCIAYSRRRAGP